jgi:hypothetical protein
MAGIFNGLAKNPLAFPHRHGIFNRPVMSAGNGRDGEAYCPQERSL